MTKYHCTGHTVYVWSYSFGTSLRLHLQYRNTEVSLMKYRGLVYQTPLTGPGKLKREFSFGSFLVLFYLQIQGQLVLWNAFRGTHINYQKEDYCM